MTVVVTYSQVFMPLLSFGQHKSGEIPTSVTSSPPLNEAEPRQANDLRFADELFALLVSWKSWLAIV